MKKSIVVIALLLILASVFSVNALVTKRSATWGFGTLTGMAFSTQPINPGSPPCPANFVFTNKESITYSFDVKVSPTDVRITPAGSPASFPLHFYESNSQNNKTILAKEFFVLTSKTSPQFTHILQFVGFNIPDRTLTFHDLGTGTREITYDNNNAGTIVVAGIGYAVYFNPATERLAIDQNADGFVNSQQAIIAANDDKTYNQVYFTGNPNCVPPQPQCTDSDGGKNFYVKGTNHGLNSYNGDQVDFCFNYDDLGKIPYENLYRSEGTGVIEHYCDTAGNVANEGYKCELGCKDGACIKAPPCLDSDKTSSQNLAIYRGAGLTPQARPDVFTKGYVNYSSATGVFNVYNDACRSESYLAEGLCQQDKYFGLQGITCPNGCRDGVCVPLEQPTDVSGCPSRFSFVNAENIPYNFDILVFSEGVDIGALQNNYRLHFYEAKSRNEKKVLPKEYFVLTRRAGQNLFTHILKYEGINTTQRQLKFTDLGTGAREVVYNNQNRAELVVAGTTYRIYVDTATGGLAVDQNGNGVMNGEQAPIIDINRVTTTQETFTQNPACVVPPCSESDGGIDYYVKGMGKAGSDCCLNDKGECADTGASVKEIYCDPASPLGFSTITFTCPNGCSEGACLPFATIGPPPVREIGEQVTCQFLFQTTTNTCSSSKGSCSAPRNYAICTLQVGGAPGEKVDWTSTCGVPAVVTTTMDGTAENALFVCGSMPDIDIPPTWKWP